MCVVLDPEGPAWWHVFRLIYKQTVFDKKDIGVVLRIIMLKRFTCCRSCQQEWKLASEWCRGGAWNLTNIVDGKSFQNSVFTIVEIQ